MKPRILFLTIAVSLACAAPASAITVTPRVVGGAPAGVAQWPFIAALIQHGADAYNGQFCGGSVISPTAVLTAAHCAEGASAGSIDVVTGRTRLSDAGSGQRIAVSRVIVDPSYDSSREYHDAAVLLLAQPTSAPPVALAQPPDAALTGPGAPLAVAGWGLLGAHGPSPDDLHAGAVHAMPTGDCADAYGPDFAGAFLVCAGSPSTRTDSCPGDSGGPLVSTVTGAAVEVGIVAFGGDVCGDPSAPGAYTRVSAETAWIQRVAGLTGAAPPAPAPPPAQPSVRTRIGTISCGAVMCRVDVAVSGSYQAVGRVVVSVVRGGASPVHVAASARRVSARVWRAYVNLPYGSLRLTATPYTSARVGLGGAGSERVNVTAG